jgi:hypothetical protein
MVKGNMDDMKTLDLSLHQDKGQSTPKAKLCNWQYVLKMSEP